MTTALLVLFAFRPLPQPLLFPPVTWTEQRHQETKVEDPLNRLTMQCLNREAEIELREIAADIGCYVDNDAHADDDYGSDHRERAHLQHDKKSAKQRFKNRHRQPMR